MTIAANLLQGRPVRLLKERIDQMRTFRLSTELGPAAESIITTKGLDTALLDLTPLPMGKYRVAEYAAYRSGYPEVPLGQVITWVEGGNFYHHSVPDVPVVQGGKTMSLRKARGMVVYDSIGLLQINRDCANVFTVSAISEAALEGRVRVLDFIRNGWALPDERGFPLESLRAFSAVDAGRLGVMLEIFNEESNGWHGSISRYLSQADPNGRRYIYAADEWSDLCGVPVAGPAPAAQPKPAP